MRELINSPIFGILLTTTTYILGVYIYQKTRITLFHPTVVSIVLLIACLLGFNIDLESYNIGGDMIKFFLGPATIVLAIPLYKKIDVLKKNVAPILVGIFMGSLIGILSVIGMAKIMHFPREIIISLVPKAVTNPIGIEVCNKLGGIQSITIVAILVTGTVGAVIGPSVCKLCGIKNKIAIGIALGTASHAFGTTKALELGELEGAMSGLAIGLAGLAVVFLAPILTMLIK